MSQPTTPTKTSPTLAVYLGAEFAAQVQHAQQEGKFDPKELCKQVLQDAVDGKFPASDTDTVAELRAARTQAAEYLDILNRSQEAWGKVAQELLVDINLPGEEFTAAVLSRIGEMRVKAALGEQAQHPAQVVTVTNNPLVGFELDVHWLDTEEALRAQLDNLRDQGGWPVSTAPTVDGRFFLLAAWPLP